MRYMIQEIIRRAKALKIARDAVIDSEKNDEQLLMQLGTMELAVLEAAEQLADLVTDDEVLGIPEESEQTQCPAFESDTFQSPQPWPHHQHWCKPGHSETREHTSLPADHKAGSSHDIQYQAYQHHDH